MDLGALDPSPHDLPLAPDEPHPATVASSHTATVRVTATCAHCTATRCSKVRRLVAQEIEQQGKALEELNAV
jgi:hypothetical protein